ncbi:hypothetical protein CPB86DRAFT_782157 [Serendipita vermifera]|nr:hypothetical protein CPB86DRAFT_782157 [Serendipita vermifera]
MSEEQASLTRTLNEKLPYDILKMIFDVYSQWDGIDNPLEKLLCICRHWSIATTQHKTLWTSFRISSSSLKDLQFWYSRISRRIELTGHDAFIDLHMRYEQREEESNSARMDKRELFRQLLTTLIGQERCLIKRWRTVHLESTERSHRWLWNQALSYPTPNLTSLTIVRMEYSVPILPFAPHLHQLVAAHSSFKLCCRLPQLKSLIIANPKKKTIIDAEGITLLKLTSIREPVQLPSNLPALRELFLAGHFNSKIVSQVSVPRLQRMRLNLFGGMYDRLFEICREIDLERLDTLQLASLDTYKDRFKLAARSIKKVVQAAKNVRNFVAFSRPVLRILLVCIQDGSHPETLRRGCKLGARWTKIQGIRDQVNITFELGADSLVTTIHQIRTTLKLPQDETWDSLMENLVNDPNVVNLRI